MREKREDLLELLSFFFPQPVVEDKDLHGRVGERHRRLRHRRHREVCRGVITRTKGVRMWGRGGRAFCPGASVFVMFRSVRVLYSRVYLRPTCLEGCSSLNVVVFIFLYYSYVE